jgi:hypothetical protein
VSSGACFPVNGGRRRGAAPQQVTQPTNTEDSVRTSGASRWAQHASQAHKPMERPDLDQKAELRGAPPPGPGASDTLDSQAGIWHTRRAHLPQRRLPWPTDETLKAVTRRPGVIWRLSREARGGMRDALLVMAESGLTAVDDHGVSLARLRRVVVMGGRAEGPCSGGCLPSLMRLLVHSTRSHSPFDPNQWAQDSGI